MTTAEKVFNGLEEDHEYYESYIYRQAAEALGGEWHAPPESDGSFDPSGIYVFPDGSMLHVTCSYAEVLDDPAQTTGSCSDLR